MKKDFQKGDLAEVTGDTGNTSHSFTGMTVEVIKPYTSGFHPDCWLVKPVEHPERSEFIHEDDLDPLLEPVTAEELKAVYKSLGVHT